MKLYKRQIVGAIFVTLLAGSPVQAEDTNTLEIIQRLLQRIDQLEQKVKALEHPQNEAPAVTNAPASQERIDQLDQKVKVLERQREVDQEVADAKAKEMPKISVGDRGFSLESANGNFGVQLKGVLQVDSRTFFDDHGVVGNDGILLRRARPILQGTVYRDFDFLFVPDFGGTGSPQIFDAYLNYRYSPELQFQAGKFKSPVGLEQLQADVSLFFNERALATDLVPNRDLGFELHGDLFKGIASYAAGIFNGVGDARNSSNADVEDDKSFAGRLFFQPLKTSGISALEGFGFGAGGSYEQQQGSSSALLPATTGGTLGGFATVGQQQFFAYNPTNGVVVSAGEHWRLSPQGYYTYGPFEAFGEYVISDQQVARTTVAPFTSRRLQNTGWDITGGWVLTGEDAVYGGMVTPRHAFDPHAGDWGALQVVARYSELNVDHAAFPLFSDPATSASSAHEWSVGLNWYLNRNLKVATSFSRTTFDGGGGRGTSAPASITRQAENVLFTRIQLSF